jgi:hypothetical protein
VIAAIASIDESRRTHEESTEESANSDSDWFHSVNVHLDKVASRASSWPGKSSAGALSNNGLTQDQPRLLFLAALLVPDTARCAVWGSRIAKRIIKS